MPKNANTQPQPNLQMMESTSEAENDFDYLVKLPLTRYDAHVRGLLVKEEDMIKSNNTTPKYTYESVCRLIYSCTKFEIPGVTIPATDENAPVTNPFGTFEEFMKNIPPADRDALLWGIIMKTYDETEEVTMICDNCKNRFNVKFEIPSLMQIKNYEGKDPIMQKEVILPLPEHNWIVHIKQPSLKDELSILSYNTSNTKLTAASQYMMVTKIETKITKVLDSGAKKSGESYTVTTPLEIYGMIANKPAKVRKQIMKAWEDNFGDYGTTVTFECTCPECRNLIRTQVVPMTHLFQMVQ